MGAASSFLPTNPIIPHIVSYILLVSFDHDDLDRTNSAGSVRSPARSQGLCSGVSPGLCSLGLAAVPGRGGASAESSMAERWALRRSPLLVTLPMGRGMALSLVGGLSPAPPSFQNSALPIFVQYPAASAQDTVRLLPPGTIPDWEMPVLYHTSAPLTSPGFVNFFPQARAKAPGPT